MLNEKEKIELITQISLDIGEVKDLDILLERILTNVRRFFRAEAGSIYLKEGNKLNFSYTQNEVLQNRLENDKKLIYNTFSMPIDNRSIAGYVANNSVPLNIDDVYKMGESAPYSFDSHFDRVTRYKCRSMLTVPMTDQRGHILGIMQVINARDDNGNIIAFAPIDESLINNFASSAALALDRAKLTRNIILRMISMAEMRDPDETSGHVNRVAAYSVEIFEEWAKINGLGKSEINREKDILRMASMLHDVGKIAISDVILKKPEQLTNKEYETIKSHTFLGAKLFKDSQSGFEEVAALVALNHHEKWNGTGYPGHIDLKSMKPSPDFLNNNGDPRPKKGVEIPLYGRIVAVADVYDALCSRRAYKEPWKEDRILEEMHSLSGTHFDPAIMEAFFKCLDILKSIAKRYPDMNRL